MAVYRPEQAQLTYAAEAAFAGDSELAEGNPIGSGFLAAALVGVHNAGSLELSVDGGTSSQTPTVGDFIQIGATAGTYSASLGVHEIRRIEWYETTATNAYTLGLDRPTGFHHLNNTVITRVDGINVGTDYADSKHIVNLPGVYEAVDAPDMASGLEPQYFLSTTNRRSFQSVLKQQQVYDSSLTMTPLDGKSFRWAIGKVTTCMDDMSYTDTNTAGGYTTLASAAKKGDSIIYVTHALVFGTVASTYLTAPTMRYITFLDANHNDGTTNSGTTDTAAGAMGSNPESRRVVKGYNPSSTQGYIWLDQPLQFDHASGTAVASGALTSAKETYRHVISETDVLDTMSWHIHMLDTAETGKTAAANAAVTADSDFDRRYTGGKVGSMTISAEESGLVQVSWDTINFRGMHHNNRRHNALSEATGGPYKDASVLATMPFFALMQDIKMADVDYPDTEPYYFSDGQLKFFGETFAQIRSFSISINNNTEPRYYVQRSFGRFRGPNEIREQRREYTMTATVVLPDTEDAFGAGNKVTATNLFRELLLEGDYGSGASANTQVQGFTASLRFDRGTDDYIIIDIPQSQAGTAFNTGGTYAGDRGKPVLVNQGTPSAGHGNAVTEDVGLFIRSAAHNLTADAPLQVELDTFFKNMVIYIKDNEPSYI